jgi:hypothetical protein
MQMSDCAADVGLRCRGFARIRMAVTARAVNQTRRGIGLAIGNTSEDIFNLMQNQFCLNKHGYASIIFYFS